MNKTMENLTELRFKEARAVVEALIEANYLTEEEIKKITGYDCKKVERVLDWLEKNECLESEDGYYSFIE